MNKMREIYIEKVSLNIGTGSPGEAMEKSLRLLKNLTGMKPVTTRTKKRIPAWGLRPGLQIGCKVTIRKQKAEELLKRVLAAKNDRLKPQNFDNNGNFSFGIQEYLDIPEAEYDIQVGIIGLEAAITLSRPGFRIKKRRNQKRKIPSHHGISKAEAIKFIQDKYSITLEEE